MQVITMIILLLLGLLFMFQGFIISGFILQCIGIIRGGLYLMEDSI